MSVFAALFTSSQAMTTQSHVMERISDNVANMNTTGYKSFDAHLRESVNHISPKGTFVSVGSVDIRHADKQGIIQGTGRALDVAINGSGYFITNPKFDGTGTQHFTRDGATTTALGDDGNAYLTNTSGQYYLGWQADANGDIDTDGPLVPIQTDAVEGLPGEPTTEVSFSGNVTAGSTGGHTFEVPIWSTPDAEGETEPYSLVMAWEPNAAAPNTWTVGYSVRGPDGASQDLETVTTVTFNGRAQMLEPLEPQTLTLPFADGTTTDVTLDLTGMTQFGETPFQVTDLDSNGFPAGRVSGKSFDGLGRLTAQYSNGQSRVLYQLAVADFPAPQNLVDAGNTAFTYSPDAGLPEIYGVTAGSQRTSIMAGSVEASTVDLTDEFSNMITTQKAYSTSATVFRTSDEMVRTASNLKQ
jgi:flagellar hook protein FlgE